MSSLLDADNDTDGQSTGEQATLAGSTGTSSESTDTPPGSNASPDTTKGIETSTEFEFERPSVAGEVDSEQVTQYSADGLNDWRESREENNDPYAFYHLSLYHYTDLTTDARWLDVTTRTSHDTAVSESRVNSGMSLMSPNEQTVTESLVSWYLSLMAVPYHNTARPIPADNIRIFVADEAVDALSDAGVELSPVIDKLRSIPEHNPSDEYLQLLDEYRTVVKQSSSDSKLSDKIQNIEATVRAKFDFARKYGGPAPDPHKDYEQLSPDQLKDELEDARSELDQKQARAEELSTMLDELEENWKSEIQQQMR